MIKIAIYARVSTTRGQSPGMQLSALREFCEMRGLSIYKEYIDEGISENCDSSPALNRLMADARKGMFDLVLVWKFHRFIHSTEHLIKTLKEFRALGIDVYFLF